MAFTDRLAFASEQKKIKQADLGKMIETSGDIISKYERGENVPFIDVVAKIADALIVKLNYLIKDAEYEHIDNDTLKCPKEVQGLDAENHSRLFPIIDAFIKAKLKSIAVS